jgi:hypothetical protein
VSGAHTHIHTLRQRVRVIGTPPNGRGTSPIGVGCVPLHGAAPMRPPAGLRAWSKPCADDATVATLRQTARAQYGDVPVILSSPTSMVRDVMRCCVVR